MLERATIQTIVRQVLAGGQGSGNFGHRGRPGLPGGSGDPRFEKVPRSIQVLLNRQGWQLELVPAARNYAAFQRDRKVILVSADILTDQPTRLAHEIGHALSAPGDELAAWTSAREQFGAEPWFNDQRISPIDLPVQPPALPVGGVSECVLNQGFLIAPSLLEVIRKEGDSIVLYSKDGSKKLGTWEFGPDKAIKSEDSAREHAAKRERQIQFFKHQGG